MSRRIDEATVRHIAHLARLKLSDAEIARFSTQLSDIIAYADQLNQLDTTGVAPTAHPLPVHNVFREDVPTEPLGAERVLANAPQAEAGCFALPKVLEQEGA
jgi:aspartyl-tRNA(Asn)/glutamyl-tRNA(Gln) amidotransferase subunit C